MYVRHSSQLCAVSVFVGCICFCVCISDSILLNAIFWVKLMHWSLYSLALSYLAYVAVSPKICCTPLTSLAARLQPVASFCILFYTENCIFDCTNLLASFFFYLLFIITDIAIVALNATGPEF